MTDFIEKLKRQSQYIAKMESKRKQAKAKMKKQKKIDKISKSAPTYSPQQVRRSKRFAKNNPNSDLCIKKIFSIKNIAVFLLVGCLGICGYKYYDYKAYENSIDKAEELTELVSDVKDCKIEVKDNTATVYAKLYVKPKRLQKEIKEDIIKRVKSCKIKNVNKIKVEF